jgi:hypothetical protein
MIETEAPQSVDEKALVRARWLTELRRQGHRQCIGNYFKDDGQACAIGLLAEVAGLRKGDAVLRLSEEIGALAGLTMDESHIVVEMNDGICCLRPRTFAEIADIVEGWFR